MLKKSAQIYKKLNTNKMNIMNLTLNLQINIFLKLILN